MNYANYSAAELARDASFQQWVLGQDAAARAFWTNWRLEHPEKEGEIEKAIDMLKLLEFGPDVEQNQHFVNVWQQVYAHTLAKQQPSYWRVAAIWIGGLLLSGLAVFWLLSVSSGNEFTGDTTARKETFSLPDGSTIVLNKHSSFAYRVTNDGDRVVTLRGEGFFEVTKQKAENRRHAKFTVYTETAAIEVVGTSFNVSESGQKTQVVLSTGKVKVTSLDQEVIRLEPGELVEVRADQPVLKKEKVNPRLYASWVDGQAIFEQATLPEILAWVEDRYDKPVQIDSARVDPDSLTFTATIPDGDLATLLEALSITYELDIRQTDQRIEISRPQP